MTIERSHDKARPTLVRSDDLRLPPETDSNRPLNHGPGGHFTAGNTAAQGARFKKAVRKALGTASTGEVAVVASDAKRVFAHVLRSLPSLAAPVRVLVTIHARHVALNAYYTTKAEAAGLDSLAGQRLLEIADRQSQRAERTLVTALDVARVCAEREAKASGGGLAALRAQVLGGDT